MLRHSRAGTSLPAAGWRQMGRLCGAVLFLFSWAHEAKGWASRDSSDPAASSVTPHPLPRASGDHNDKYQAVLRQQLLSWYCLPVAHRTPYWISFSADCLLPAVSLLWSAKRKHLPHTPTDDFSSPLSRTNLGMGFPEGGDVCVTAGREAQAHAQNSFSSCSVKTSA